MMRVALAANFHFPRRISTAESRERVCGGGARGGGRKGREIHKVSIEVGQLSQLREGEGVVKAGG